MIPQFSHIQAEETQTGEAWGGSLKRISELSALNVANACFAFEVLWFLTVK